MLRLSRPARILSRRYATVDSSPLIARPPPDPPTPAISELDARVLSRLYSDHGKNVGLQTLVQQYYDRSGRTLEPTLPYESRPAEGRRVNVDSSDDILVLVHCARDKAEHKITLSSAFALNVPGLPEGQSIVLSCSHTLEEASAHIPQPIPIDQETSRSFQSGSFVLSRASGTTKFHPVTSISSSLHHSDLLLATVTDNNGTPRLPNLPISPYPAHPGTPVRAHFVTSAPPAGDPTWMPWIFGLYSKWVSGTIVGYRDFAGREASPGTDDALTHLLFHPPPTAGSSGGPIVDQESGAVVGIMQGHRMDYASRVEGIKGWGVPSEAVFEVSLPFPYILPRLKFRSRLTFVSVTDVQPTRPESEEIVDGVLLLFLGSILNLVLFILHYIAVGSRHRQDVPLVPVRSGCA
ncbi:hypothetical protein PUNSTDRAFT_56321 [Punctularia strigosozonata HHB-11173 SS5]|uniref:uncharacterized protein n=1 Tax=Punctularia strigosozonata (strain HHB-11173) TaxID=741275 RepID=UPI0004417642|nr:uncharacterized protein PUNSTDRAFT_56321 [Punctularia strigosozonata HHB-11173 SS5]EIN13568.1 hypothetical protein PUNSTDRAFT_56321 [Punctularia strigosozonata HHB-11173 SS5]